MMHRLKVPALDLTFYEFYHNEQPEVLILVPGGGGSAKSDYQKPNYGCEM
jgi:hypothetical protein